jgi:hypothetical protein
MLDTDHQILLVGVAALAVLTAGLAGGVAADATSAGDQPTQIYPAEEVQTVAPGETAELDVWIRSDGGVGDVAVESISFNATYDDSILTVKNVEPEPWLEGDEPTEVTTDVVAESGGRVTVEQAREPPAGGTQGHERFVTLTVEVAEDAPAGNTTVQFDESNVLLTDQYPVPIYAVNATLTVEEKSSSPVDPVMGAAVVGAAAALVVGVVVARRL